jgi:hypothetical protein
MRVAGSGDLGERFGVTSGTLLEELAWHFTQNVQFLCVAGVAAPGPLGASVDVTDARSRVLALSIRQCGPSSTLEQHHAA